MKKVKLKSAEEFKKMRRQGLIECVYVCDSGEWVTYATKENPSVKKTFWWEEFGEEYAVIDHPNPISKESYEAMKDFFEEE